MRWSHLSATAGADTPAVPARPLAQPLAPSSVEPFARSSVEPLAPSSAEQLAEPLAQPGVIPLALPGATVRTFDTPTFAGMTFYEITAKSMINRVPGESRVPFEWTVNPYRGCSHACTYCLGGDTPILLADGTTRPIARLVAGDTVYGTVGVGTDRRYVPTPVLDQWRTTKPGYRVTLADGTRLVAGGDHRFLTARGWRYVTDDHTHRPTIEPGDTLYGVGRFGDPAKETPDYQAGYLCGLLRGDAGQRPARSRGPAERAPGGGTSSGVAYAWQRADDYLRTVALDVALRWPDSPTDGWQRGFLAGAYGAIGRTDGLRVSFPTGDRSFQHRVTAALHHLGLPSRLSLPSQLGPPHQLGLPSRLSPPYQLGPPDREGGQLPLGGRPTVEIVGDLREALRFRHLTGADAPFDATGRPAETGRPLTVHAVEALGLTLPLFDLTTGTGDFIADGVISHNCFARHTHTYLDLDAGHDFDSKIIVKVNAGAVVRRELAAPRWRRAPIAMGTNVDCYQRAEGRYRLMPPILAALRDFANPFSILTKGTLIRRDLELLRQAATVTDVRVAFSIGFVDRTLWRAVEPGTPSPQSRLDAVRAFADAGFAVNVLMAPILPGLTDSAASIESTVAAIAAAGAVGVTPLPLHLRPGAQEWYAAWLSRTHPELVPRYRELFASGAYLPQAYQREIGARVRLAARRHGLHRDGPPVTARGNPDISAGSSAAAEQLTLL